MTNLCLMFSRKFQSFQNVISFSEVLVRNPIEDGVNDIADVAPSRKRRQRGVQPVQPQIKRPAQEQRQNFRSESLTLVLVNHHVVTLFTVCVVLLSKICTLLLFY